MFCSQCGGQVHPGAQFCGQCGRPVIPGSAVTPRPVVEPVTARIRTNVPGFVKEQLHASEQVIAAFNVSIFDHHREHDLRHDKILLTTERIIYYRTALVHKSLGEMSYRMITGVRYNRGLIHGQVIIDGANAGLTLRGIGNDDAAFAEKIIAGRLAGRQYEVT